MYKIKVLVPVANGTEDIEAVTIIDICRRADFDVTVAGIYETAVFARGLNVVADLALKKIFENEYDAVILPGGAVGVENLYENDILRKIILEHFTKNKLIGAICAAPLILHKLGLLSRDYTITSHPSVKDKIGSCNYSEEPVVVSNNIITSRGAGTSVMFALEIVKILAGNATAEHIANSIVYYY